MEPFSSSTQVHGNRPIRMDNEDFTRLYNLKKSFGGCIIIIIIMYNCTFHKCGSMPANLYKNLIYIKIELTLSERAYSIMSLPNVLPFTI